MKKIAIVLSLLITITMLFTGCGSKEVEMTKISENDSYIEYEILCSVDDKELYGIACVPVDASDTLPTVIFSHGFGGNVEHTEDKARYLAENGIASYRFDFYGGSKESQSGGEMTEMSIFTEKSELEAVLAMVQTLDFVDTENIYLFGESQGGAVSAITANDHEDEIKGMILLYPAFCIPDDAREMFTSVDEIPETVDFLGTTIGKTYYENLLDYDIYEYIGNYKKDVLILHGDIDGLVDISYSEKALEVYDSAKLIVLEETGHGNLSQEMKDLVVNSTYDYIMK